MKMSNSGELLQRKMPQWGVVHRFSSISALSLLAVTCGACTSAELWSTGGGHTLVTTAEYRAINQTSAGQNSVHGRVTPAYITCAEPSPDVAKAVSTALNASGSGGVTLPNGVTADVAAAVSRARAEALVQLGERLATIQLLRDGLHSACEAFANGAITDTTYAVMLSRFDKTMVTMLATEIAGGAFGRSLAAAGMASEGNASASADLEAKITKSKELEQNLKNAQDAQNAAAQDAAAAKTPDAQQAAQEKVDGTRKDVQNKDNDYKNSIKDVTASAAKVAQLNAVGGITAHNNPEIAKTIAEMQRKYIENLNFDAVEVACVSALDRENVTNAALQDGSANPFAAYCKSTLLPSIIQLKGKLYEAVIYRAEKLGATADSHAQVMGEMENSVKEVVEYVDNAKALLEKVKALKAIEMK
jgi:hypothetical protein